MVTYDRLNRTGRRFRKHAPHTLTPPNGERTMAISKGLSVWVAGCYVEAIVNEASNSVAIVMTKKRPEELTEVELIAVRVAADLLAERVERLYRGSYRVVPLK